MCAGGGEGGEEKEEACGELLKVEHGVGDLMVNEFFPLFSTPPKKHHIGAIFYLARHVVATHLEHLQLVPNLLKIFGTPSSVFVQLG